MRFGAFFDRLLTIMGNFYLVTPFGQQRHRQSAVCQAIFNHKHVQFFRGIHGVNSGGRQSRNELLDVVASSSEAVKPACPSIGAFPRG